MIVRKMTALTLIPVLAISLFGCSNNSASSLDSTGTKNPDSAAGTGKISLAKKYDIKWFQWGPRDIQPDDAIIKYLNEKFNVNIKVERILAKEYQKNLELKIAAGDMPDVFRYSLSSGAHIYSQLKEDGFLMNFTEYADKYDLKGLKSYIDRPGTEEFREENGVFQLPSRKASVVPNVMVIRQDWLDQLGLKKPTTMDEFKAVLKAFKDNKMGGANTVPVTFALGYGAFLGLSTGFTGANNWGKVDGKWSYETVMPQYKSFLQFARELYGEGLIDREVFTSNEAQAKSKFITGSAGVIVAPTERYVAIEKDLAESNKNAKLSLLIPMPKGPAGDTGRVDASNTEPIVVIKKDRDEDFLARVAAIIDYTHSEEGIKILNYGIEGVHYKMENGKMVRTALYERDIIPSLGHLTAMTSDYSLAAQDVEGALKENVEYSLKSGIAPPFTALTYGTSKDLVPSIDKKYNEWIINFVTGAKDINANWDQYVKEMNDAGLSKLTAAVEQNTKKWGK
ncbi:extracellular solute-binding protein [Paenibacillus sp. CGMCC 1.16610]|uniref:Extracellular solute-binding protein n=1 Tax=Paenibacillus anseongense TaxID=2682845 RepID=A0ABW9U3N4_9BACL|nr:MULTISPECIES: extracellular solute-binding protein [Paenibacillus]MBA2938729.1 extracellular solute-binding protein [Paenibacillus sp. CGMCC 1.16610]MVQ34692.1 extracellular solute-binding protein [Paenibacillus anseongense]